MKVANSLPRVYYGLHMNQGVAEYRPKGQNPFRVLIGEDAIRKMDRTFTGRPLFVGHKPDADPTDVKAADGVVVESFYNKADGMHWAKFIVFTEQADQAIGRGLTLSNCYEASNFGAGGLANGVQYDKEILDGGFHHMALVADPRYENSVIYTPEQFKKYNEEKEAQVLRLANSKKGEQRMSKFLNLFKRQKIENSADYEEMVVELPLSKKEMTLTQLVNSMDASMMPEHMAHEDHCVMVGDQKMKINELRDKYMSCMNELSEMKKAKDGDDEKAKLANAEKEAADLKDKDEKAKLANSEKEVKDKEEKEKMSNALFFEQLDKAPTEMIENSNEPVVDLGMDQVARGQSRYGSAALKH